MKSKYVPEKNYWLWLICDLKCLIYVLFFLKYVKIRGVNPIMAEYVLILEYIPEYHIPENGILVISEYPVSLFSVKLIFSMWPWSKRSACEGRQSTDKIWMKSTTFSQIKKSNLQILAKKRVQSSKDFWPNLQSTDKLPPLFGLARGRGITAKSCRG